MEQNNTGKYFKYAIGEIILVVIGILIALQINNWNENKKERKYEVKMLTEIEKALESDIAYFTRLEDRLQKLDSASDVFIRLVHEKAVFNDTLYMNGRSRWYYLRTGINLQFNTGPYEALKSSGLDKVSNDSLRNELIDFYDFKFPMNIDFIRFFDKSYDEDVATLKSFLNEPFTQEINGNIEVYSKFPEDLFLNPNFLNFLTRIKSRASNGKRQLAYGIKNMKQIKSLIHSEIND